MKRLNNNFLYVLLLALSSLYAKTLSQECDITSTKCDPSQLILPDCSRFSFQFRALIMQPTASNLGYAAEALPLPVPSPNWNIFEIKPHYHFGFEVGASTFIHERNTRVRANWLHFKHSDHDAQQVSSTNDMIGPFFAIGPDTLVYKQTEGTTSFNFNTANVTYGQLLNVCNNLQAVLFVGINFSRISQTLFSRFSNLENTIIRTIEVPIVFTGAGPQCGIDLYYFLSNNFFLTAKAASSLVMGSLKNKTTFQTTSPDLTALNITPPNTQTTSPETKTQSVPAFDIQLGVSYCRSICNDYTVHFEAGYQALLYINPIQSIDIGSEVVTLPVVPSTIGVYARTFERTISNFGLAGPYILLGITF